MTQPEEIKAIYDNQESIDNMTFVLTYSEGPKGEPACLATSYDGRSFSQYSYCIEGSHLGKKVSWKDLSPALQAHIVSRLK